MKNLLNNKTSRSDLLTYLLVILISTIIPILSFSLSFDDSTTSELRRVETSLLD